MQNNHADVARAIVLPEFFRERVIEHGGPDRLARLTSWLRSADVALSIDTLKCVKASRLSFADMLVDLMARQKWSITQESVECDAEGAARFVYRIDAGGHAFTYIARAYAWDGKEKVGRRSDGANRDMFGALFHSLADASRIEREFETFDLKNVDLMRTDSDVIGWTPANRSSRYFDEAVDALVRGEQPHFKGDSQYVMRNGGFQSSGRNGSISYPGIPADHPLHHPFFADLFAIFLVRQVSVDLVNAVARVRNPRAAQLSHDAASQLGIGNSSGQGMCVALQRWPHWVSTWVTAREVALAYAKSTPIDTDSKARLGVSLAQARERYAASEPQTESYVTPNAVIVDTLEEIGKELACAQQSWWGDFTSQSVDARDSEARELFNSLLLDLVPEFCDAIKPYFTLGVAGRHVPEPAMPVGELRRILRCNYDWALKIDRSLASSHQHFWYHSEDNGEQRRGDRIVDPFEQFESFIDHVGLVHRLAAVLTAFPDEASAGEVIFNHPDLHYAIARVQSLRTLPYAEIRGNLADEKFLPSDLIRFFLASLGIRSAKPLSIRYVRGTFFQGVPLLMESKPAGDVETNLANEVHP